MQQRENKEKETTLCFKQTTHNQETECKKQKFKFINSFRNYKELYFTK